MAKAKGCPICGQPTHAEYAPFCSRGCKDRDLLQWLGEGYRLPGAAIDPDDAEGAQSGLDTPGDRD
ncbi:DNA gyrase inhibitor YacG [Sphingomonas baiyangensis]|nr:DNA gyrase inhibitor YacG [Sphingomonas baiyangensis]